MSVRSKKSSPLPPKAADERVLTENQRATLEAIRQHQAEVGMMPTRMELVRRMGLRHQRSIDVRLRGLARRGAIKLLPRLSRGIRVLEEGQQVPDGELPVIMRFGTKELPAEPDVTAPDGSRFRELLSLDSGSAAHFELPAGTVSRAGRHRTVDEIWYILGGSGEMWRRDGNGEELVTLKPGLCLTIPVGTSFQFRATGGGPLSTFAVTMPPWPAASEDEWLEVGAYWAT